MKKRSTQIWSVILSIALVLSGITVPVKDANASSRKAESENPKIESDVSISATNSFGRLFQDSLNKKTAEQEENNGYNVYSVEVQEKTATVSMETLEECTLVVGIYEEDGIKMLATGEKEVTQEDREVTLDIDIDTMPEYFLVRAFLVESESLHPLCTVYESPMYTQEMQEFMSKTTEDFEEDRVLNLDEDITNNFAVYEEDTKVIEETDSDYVVSCTDETTQTYVIENADESITSLQQGEIFVYEQENKEVLIVKIASITVDGTTVTITGEDTTMDEVFEYVKIDSTMNTSEAEVDTSTCSEGVQYEGKVERTTKNGNKKAFEGEGVIGASLAYTLAETEIEGKDKDGAVSGEVKAKVSGSVSIEASIGIKAYVSLSQQYVELKIDYALSTAVSFSGSAKGAISFARIEASPVPGVFVRFIPSFVVEVNAAITFEGTLEGTAGMYASMKDGVKNLTNSPKLTTKLAVQGSIFVGISLEPQVVILTNSFVKGSLEAKAGVEAATEMELLKSSDTEEEKHKCEKCIAGTLHAKVEMKAGLQFFKSEKLKLEASKTFLLKIGDFYYSYDYNDFGFSLCPHRTYKIVFVVKNPSGDVVEGVSINDKSTTNSEGIGELWLPSGSHQVKAVKDGVGSVTKKVKVEKKPKKVVMTLKEEAGSGEEGEDDNNDKVQENPLTGKKVREIVDFSRDTVGVITEEGDLYAWGDNFYGSVGIGEIEDTSISSPEFVMSNVKEASLDLFSSYVITEDGDLFLWGLCTGTGEEPIYTPTLILSNVRECGELTIDALYAITASDDLYVWGSNSGGALGIGVDDEEYYSESPVKVMSNVREVVSGDGYYGVITENNDLYIWGSSFYDDNPVITSLPTKILSNVEQAVLGYMAGAVTKEGEIYLWEEMGENLRKKEGIIGAQKIYINNSWKDTYFVLNENSELYFWGDRMGTGNEEREYITDPELILSEVDFFEIDNDVCFSVTKDGSLYIWGEDEYGRLRVGDNENKSIPTKILSDVQLVQSGYSSMGALTKSGELYLWGENDYGQIGDGSRENQLLPKKILSNVKQMHITLLFSMALSNDGIVYTWGDDSSGKCGDGEEETYEGNLIPTPINAPVKTQTLKTAANTSLKGDSSSKVYTWVGEATGWGGPDSYPASAEHEQGTTAATYDSGLTNIQSSVGYGCGLEFMNPYNEDFVGDEDELSVILYSMVEPCVKVTLENGGTAYSWNWHNQMEFPSGEEIVIPKEYFEPQYFALFGGDDTITKVEIFDAADSFSKGDNITASEPVLTGLTPNATYNFYIMKSADGENLLNSDNLLYLSQQTTDANGNLCVSYEMKESYANPVIFAKRVTKNNLADATITVPNFQYNEKKQYVTPEVKYQGVILEEGKDYEISGAFCVKDAGEYTITLTGIGDYTGSVDKVFQVTSTASDYDKNADKDTKKKEVSKPAKVKWKSCKAKKRGKVVLKWKKVSGADGYQVQYAKKKNFKGKKSKTTYGKSTTLWLKSKKKYFIRVRAYKYGNVKYKVYGKWSKIKKVKTKK